MKKDCLSRVTLGENKIPVSTSLAPAEKGATSTSGSCTSRNRLYALATH